MSFSQHLVLWLHVTFVAFTIGPVTLAVMSTPRYIRQRDVRIVRYLSRITFIFTLGSLGVLIAGIFLAEMLHKSGKPWIIVSATLFLVSILMLALIVRDQRHAIKALEEAGSLTAVGASAGDAAMAGEHGDEHRAGADQPADAGEEAGAGPATSAEVHLASVERGRIAMIGGLVSLIWLVILVLMVWNS